MLTVSELTTRVKGALESQVGEVWVEGEISNLRAQASGHMYFSIKDARTQLTCVLFRGTRVRQRELMEDGQKVVLQGDLTVYEQRGQYQLIVRAVELQGVGALQAKFEKLKAKLQAEGLFDAETKQELPRFPNRIGIVTSSSAAALRDVLHVIRRRQPSLQIVLAASRVQGQGADNEIADAIGQLNRWTQCERLDLILVTRGGGSLEDLWVFNEEAVARAIHVSTVPVVSAVGHEIDFTISDFVADVRAATPSVAAEIITAGAMALRVGLDDTSSRMMRQAHRRLGVGQTDVSHLLGRLLRCHPRRRLQEHMQQVDELGDVLRRCRVLCWRRMWERWKTMSDRLRRFRPWWAIALRRDGIARLNAGLSEKMSVRLRRKMDHLVRLEERLRLLSPKNVMARGYSITWDSRTGEIVSKAAGVEKGQRIRTRVSEGEFDSTVE